jgi:glutathione S-transferase
MTGLVLTTLDWVPEFARGHVRDLRVRWALEEASLAYTVTTTPFDSPESRLPFQPFAQVPWLTDGGVTIFESGAILLYLGELNSILMPKGPADKANVLAWVLAAVNSLEPPVFMATFFRDEPAKKDSPGRVRLERFMRGRLSRLEAVVSKRDWLAGAFSIADILMVDALRLLDGTTELSTFPACQDYTARAMARPAFRKAYRDQMAHFQEADLQRMTEKVRTT